jgi:epoxyqueuosine reductase
MAASVTALEVKAEAARLGFMAAGITDLSPTPHGAELDDWLARGYAGTMRYLHRQAKKRKAPQRIDQEAIRVVVVLENYYSEDLPADLEAPRVAKYARGEDYHGPMLRRLDQLADFLRQNGARVARTYADTGPVPERELAQRAGLGWIGKNSLLIHPKAGSFSFIGTVFTDLPLAVDSPFELDRCGSCTRCLEACPTDAFAAPRVLDATKCISYLTIEHRGPIPEAIVPQLDGWAFGCDACQDVCPWNTRFAVETTTPELSPRRLLRGVPPDVLDSMDEVGFAARFGDTPFARPGLEGMQRNLRAAFASRTGPE